ncbi:MAG: M12 family metallopeptidase [Candidatus Accumulibacter sp. UW26]|jgi:hypothetical protein
MYENVRICHDRLLPREQAMMQPQQTVSFGPGPARAVFFFRKMWINGSTLRVRFMGGNPAQQALVREQALWWTQHANLTFDFNNAPDAEIRIAFNSSDGAWSYIGTDCQGIPRNQPTMNLGFLDGGTAAHEFGHAIGLGHEHQNPDGGIEWNEEVVMRELSGPPNNWSPEEIRHNVLEKYAVDQIRGTKFDPESIMLYFFPGSWVRSGKGTQANDVLSPMEKEFIASKDAYPRVDVQGIELGINAAPTPASIGQPGEEDLFRFTVRQGGRHVIETGGQTDVVMKLFGPDVQTRLIAEDDDGGVGLNSRIAIPLNPGEYFAQVRHYNKRRGTGSYSIRVNR